MRKVKSCEPATLEVQAERDIWDVGIGDTIDIHGLGISTRLRVLEFPTGHGHRVRLEIVSAKPQRYAKTMLLLTLPCRGIHSSADLESSVPSEARR